MTNDQIQEVKLAWARGEVVQYNAGYGWHDWKEKESLTIRGGGHHMYMAWRVKPRTIRIGEYDVPSPIQTLTDGQRYFYPALGIGVQVDHYCEGCAVSLTRLRSGILHTTREAAELHAKALLSFTDGSIK